MFTTTHPNDHYRSRLSSAKKHKQHHQSNHYSYFWFEKWMSQIHREFGKTSTFQIIVLAILIHSSISICMIYLHLSYYSETYLSKHSAIHKHPNKGKIAVYSKELTSDDIDSDVRYKLPKVDYTDARIFGPDSVNLLNSKLIDSKELTYIGWFSDHYRWEEKFQCFNNRWTLCDKIFIAKCKQDTIRAIYQFVPFKQKANVDRLYFSIRATAEQLVEQSNDAFYGLMALVNFTDGTNDLIKLKFQYESEAWSLRTLDYESSKPIHSVTVMIACFGYSGVASFTDIRLASKNAGIDPISSSHEICSWCDHLAVQKSPFNRNSEAKQEASDSAANKLNYEILALQQQSRQSNHAFINRNRPSSLVTFVSQVSMDRLTVLERSLQTWTGSVSIAIYIPVKSLSEGIQDWQRLYINKKISSLNIIHANSTILLVPSLEADNYPINSLRNLAIKMCRTRFMFLVDADFQPSPGLESNFVSFLNKYHSELLKSIQNESSKEAKRFAFVVPAFEYLETPNKDDPILKSKDELIQLIHREEPLLQPFRFFESNEAHCLTNYWKWYYTNEPYYLLTKYHDKYEPYIIVEKTKDFPLFSEALTNYGMNKVMHITELFAANYTFQVLDNVWAIHFPHRSTAYYQDFLQNLERRLRNRAQRFHVLADIIERYQVRLVECNNATT